MQRMLLKLLKYDLDVQYIPGCKMYIADCLSRNFLEIDNDDSYNEDLEFHVHTVGTSIPVGINHFEKIKEATKCDRILSTVIACVENDSWSNRSDLGEPDMCTYFKLRNQLTVVDGVLCHGQKLVIPFALSLENIFLKQIA